MIEVQANPVTLKKSRLEECMVKNIMDFSETVRETIITFDITSFTNIKKSSPLYLSINA